MSEDTLFEEIVEFPDPEMLGLYHSLVGLDEAKLRLTKEAGIMLNPDGFDQWVARFHGFGCRIFDDFLRRPPLFIFAGDVGTGKSALAKSFGAEFAKTNKASVSLYPLSLESRGRGSVGEMTRLLSSAFREVQEQAKKGFGKKGVIFLIDEADAVAQSREMSQMHHEDRAGVNALLRGIDALGASRLPVLVIMCTNRSSSLDPAVKRRAAGIFEFKRPTDEQRKKMLIDALDPVGFSMREISDLVARTGGELPFTYSDISQRLLPAIVMAAFPTERISFKHALEALESVKATPEFQSE